MILILLCGMLFVTAMTLGLACLWAYEMYEARSGQQRRGYYRNRWNHNTESLCKADTLPCSSGRVVL